MACYASWTNKVCIRNSLFCVGIGKIETKNIPNYSIIKKKKLEAIRFQISWFSVQLLVSITAIDSPPTPILMRLLISAYTKLSFWHPYLGNKGSKGKRNVNWLCY